MDEDPIFNTTNSTEYLGETKEGTIYRLSISGEQNIITFGVYDYSITLSIDKYGADIRDVYNVYLGAAYMRNGSTIIMDSNRASRSRDSTDPFANKKSETSVKLSLNNSYNDIGLYFFANFTEDEMAGIDNGIRTGFIIAYNMSVTANDVTMNENIKSKFNAVTRAGTKYSIDISGPNYAVTDMKNRFDIKLTVDHWAFIEIDDLHDIYFTLSMYNKTGELINNSTEEMKKINQSGPQSSNSMEMDIILPKKIGQEFYLNVSFEFREERGLRIDPWTFDNFIALWMYEIPSNGSLIVSDHLTELQGDMTYNLSVSINNIANETKLFTLIMLKTGDIELLNNSYDISIQSKSTTDLVVSFKTTNINSTANLELYLDDNHITNDLIDLSFNITEKPSPKSTVSPVTENIYTENDSNISQSPLKGFILSIPFILIFISLKTSRIKLKN